MYGSANFATSLVTAKAWKVPEHQTTEDRLNTLRNIHECNHTVTQIKKKSEATLQEIK